GPHRSAPRYPASHYRLRPGHGATCPEPSRLLFMCRSARRWRRLCPPPPRRRRGTAGTLRLRGGTPKGRGDRAGHGTQRKQNMGPLALAGPHLPATNVRRMGRRIHAPFFLGTAILPATAREGKVPSGRRPGTGAHMDAGPLAMLAASDALRRNGLSHRLAKPWFTNAAHRGARIMKKSCATLDSLPQGVCSAWIHATLDTGNAPRDEDSATRNPAATKSCAILRAAS